MKTDGPAYFALTFAPSVELVSTVRRFVSAFYRTVLGDAEASSRIGLATHELLENAVRYCADDEASLRVFITPTQRGCIVNVRTNNRGTQKNIERLQSLVSDIDAKDPDALYQELMMETASKEEGSGLGLARIRAEADMTITCEIAGDRIEMLARGRFDTKEEDDGAAASQGH